MPEASPVPTTSAPSSAHGGAAGSAADTHAVDVNKLAEKVYALLLADARLGLARTEPQNPPRRRGEG